MRSTGWNASAKPSGIRSILWRLWHQNGVWPICRKTWTLRYDHRVEDYRLPKGEEARLALALIIGADGTALLEAVYAADAPSCLPEIPAVETLRRVWIQNYFWEEDALRWRSKDDLPPAARFISSPYDLDAVYNKKRTLLWVGDIRSFHPKPVMTTLLTSLPM
jgi:hypothetical protein